MASIARQHSTKLPGAAFADDEEDEEDEEDEDEGDAWGIAVLPVESLIL